MSPTSAIREHPDPAASAARAAAARAASCRRRIAALHAGTPVDPYDARAAREALLAARERARTAEQRLAGRQDELAQLQARALQLAAQTATLHAVRPSSGASLRARLDASGFSLSALFTAYIALGGNCDPFELDAYLNGVAGLPAPDRAMLAHALWELQEFS